MNLAFSRIKQVGKTRQSGNGLCKVNHTSKRICLFSTERGEARVNLSNDNGRRTDHGGHYQLQ